MGEKIVVGPFNKGLVNARTAFAIDDDSFPTLINAYQWRGRVKRKRGTSILNRLRRFFKSTSTSYSATSTFNLAAGAGNLLTGFSLQTNGNIDVGVAITDTVSGNVYTDPSQDGTLVGAPGGSGTINYASGSITIVGGAAHAVSATFNYFPDLPVMGLRDLQLNPTDFIGNLGFDTKYSYNISNVNPYPIYDVSFYKNPATATYVGYTQKTNWTATTWNGQDYQQFWTVNYQGALWATNGINIPFSITNVGMQYKPIVTVTITAGGPPAIATLQITGHGLVVGDFLFINEVSTTTGINFQTGYVIAVIDANNVSIEFPNATIATNGAGGIAQYLTSRSDTAKDCLRWYDGDPTDGNVNNPTLSSTKGWVNFAPPLSQGSFSIADLPAAKYYLVGARMILPFKDRLLFLGPVVQTSAVGSQVYLQDTVIYSQNGTPYYTCSYTNTPSAAVDTPTSASNVFNPILVPTNQTATSPAFFEDQTGFGGFSTAGLSEPITTVSPNEDVLLIGFNPSIQTRFVYTGNDLIPFLFYLVDSELGSASTFSSVNLGKRVITRGNRGFIFTSQVSAERIDLQIPDQVFEINLTDNGTERFCSQRDFINEWIYFTYPSNMVTSKFPNQTLQYNYRDDSWAIFNECYTTYGIFRRKTGFTWATVGLIYPTWSSWNDPWNAGTSTLLQPNVIAGNQQGFVMIRDEGTGEGNSLYIQSFSGSQITSPDHCLNENDYIIISGCIGTIADEVNGEIFSIYDVTQNTFKLNPNIGSGTYSGGGLIKRLYVPFIQTKQFPPSWGIGRKTRIGPQQYLFTTTQNSQIQLLIFLSQNGSSAYNTGPIVPAIGSTNNSLIYSTILYTSPESTNLGLTPANINLNLVTAQQQEQTWHRMNTSLIGDTVQIGFTLSDTQMRAIDQIGNPATITAITQANPCVITCANEFDVGHLVEISGVVGMTQLNGNRYQITAVSSTTITINVDSTAFTAYISGGTATEFGPSNQFAEIEMHGFILDVSPSQVLV